MNPLVLQRLLLLLSWFAISISTSKDTSRQENSRRCTCSHSWLQPKYHNPYLKSNRSYGNFQSQLYPLQCWAHQCINNQILRCINQSHLPLCRFNYMNQMMSFCFEQNKFFNNSTSFLIICLRINLLTRVPYLLLLLNDSCHVCVYICLVFVQLIRGYVMSPIEACMCCELWHVETNKTELH